MRTKKSEVGFGREFFFCKFAPVAFYFDRREEGTYIGRLEAVDHKTLEQRTDAGHAGQTRINDDDPLSEVSKGKGLRLLAEAIDAEDVNYLADATAEEVREAYYKMINEDFYSVSREEVDSIDYFKRFEERVAYITTGTEWEFFWRVGTVDVFMVPKTNVTFN